MVPNSVVGVTYFPIGWFTVSSVCTKISSLWLGRRGDRFFVWLSSVASSTLLIGWTGMIGSWCNVIVVSEESVNQVGDGLTKVVRVDLIVK
jgi:hypothetical protein